ncbi:Gfo/Idh/MocA family protein [Poriferisphaera sp. WC338]|uniref:Gfo/Idh/MocA family protein n=1 Tax=Poriferisphaera sp. WC338 TaxID=3425129 RepID=UPI003D8164AF
MIKIGSIGAGRRGKICKMAHDPVNGVELVAVCDVLPEVIAEYQEEFGGKLFATADYKELVAREDIDAVFVTTPDPFHEEHAVAAMEAGKHVYLEKPLAITLEGCDRILETAERCGVKLYVGHNMRFFPVVMKMKEIIASGRIGEVQAIWCRHFISYGGDAYFKDWHSEREYSTGLLLQKGAHDIDVIHYLAGAYTQRTVGMGKLSVYDRVEDRRGEDELGVPDFNRANWPPLSQKGMSPKIDVEDHTMMMMSLENGVQANYMQCHYTPDDVRNYTVIGTEGRIENFGDTSSEEQWAQVRVWDRRCGYQEHGTEAIAIPPLEEGTHGGSDDLIIADFVHYLKTGENRGATALDARMSVAAGCCATESLRQGNKAMEIPVYEGAMVPGLG